MSTAKENPEILYYGQGQKPHLCPKCNGQGIVSKPPWIAGDVNEWSDSQAGGYECDVCKGEKILWR